MSLQARFAASMGRLLGPDFPSDIGLAVSGGGDSMAMLTLAHNWTRDWGLRLWVVTVDHGLRPESAAEARLVADTCAELGWPHAVARWHWDGQGNLPDAARRARLGLIARWRGGLGHVLMAHTADDLAEGFVMRLGRGAGVDGLAAMADRRRVAPAPVPGPIDGPCPPARPGESASSPGSFEILRPCLDMGRAELRHYLRVLHGRWAEDPSNADPRFDRARARALLSTLADAGLSPDDLAGAARRLRRSRAALAARAVQVWSEIGREDAPHGAPTGDLLIDRDGFAGVERDTQARLLSAALRWVAGADYAPRAEALEATLDRALAGGGGTLHGCAIMVARSAIRITREPAALPGRAPVGPDLWDGRWRAAPVSSAATQDGSDRAPAGFAPGQAPDYPPDAPPGIEIGALGDAGWRQLPERPSLPHPAALGLPALWDGARLIACPAAGFQGGSQDWGVTLCPMGRPGFRLPDLLKPH